MLDIPEHLAQRYHTLPKPTFHPDPEVREDEEDEEDWAESAKTDPNDAAARPPPIPDTG